MSRFMAHAARCGCLAAALLVIGVAAPSAWAAKPGGGGSGGGGGGGGGGGDGTGGGTIYYIGPWEGATSGGTAVMTTMNSDGSNKNWLGLGLFGNPSRELHNDYRWFGYGRPVSGSYPDGTQRMELFALRDDFDSSLNNNSSTSVQLTNDPTLQPAVNYGMEWRPGDQQISFKARRWSSTEPGATIVGAGLYTASLAFDVDGNIIGLVAQPAAPAIPFPLSGDGWPDLTQHSWDPAGNQVVYAASSGLWIADLLNSAHTPIYGGTAANPQWSPDGTRIAFRNSGSISTTKPNGTGLKDIIKRTSLWTFGRPYWSFTGSHIVCVGQGGDGNLETFRATATGGSLTNLTNTGSPLNEYPAGWR